MKDQRTMIFGSVIVVTGCIAVMALLGQSCFLPESQVDICPSGLRCPPKWRCATGQDICVKGLCGNGVLDPGEACDDGNNLPGDSCSVVCTYCGDGTKDEGEACDDGNQVSGDGCSADCLSDETCGNGRLDEAAGEECDDGNHDLGDGCPGGPAGSCRYATCGDGYLWIGIEVCDDGNTESGDKCSADCLSDESCGNGYVDVGEDCDDGNDANDDGCVAGCKNAICGDGYVQAGVEECDGDDTSDTGNCPRCQWARCGDGHPWVGVEVCDPPNPELQGYCSPDCRSVVPCGNGYVDTELGEECDDGNHSNSDACPDDPDGDPPGECRWARCGDWHVWPLVEMCDDGNILSDDGCSADCRSNEECGNGYLDVSKGESCDDGNSDTTDVCPSGPGESCQWATCGDDYIWEGFEECDGDNRENCINRCNPDCTCD